MNGMKQGDKMDWPGMLRTLVEVPGVLSPAFGLFRHYSPTNKWLAALECHVRGIPQGPMGPASLWEKRFGRTVKPEYEHAGLTCWMPIPRREKNKETGKWERIPGARPIFVLKPYWYVLSMTEGPDMPESALETPKWSGLHACEKLGVEREDFNDLDGNTLGYAYDSVAAVSPLSPHPLRTLVHEMAHVLLGHTADHGRLDDGETLERGEMEAEAEAVAYIVCATLGEPGEEESRGYVQHWLKGAPIRPKLAKRIMKLAAKVLDAGYPEDEDNGNA